jgi:hypothetical protein
MKRRSLLRQRLLNGNDSYAGKGFGKFDVQSSLSAILPTGDTAKLGRLVVWNVVAQYRVGELFLAGD